MGRTKLETPQTLTPIATSNDDDHHVLRKIGRMIPTRGKPFAPRNHHIILSLQRAADVQNPESRSAPAATFPPLNVQISF
jgi:hypothetical protein